jgi:BirA family transcriptional regulator, biotin operon repressor / biotin---[acetyl-CoA-carboxylase] ligase
MSSGPHTIIRLAETASTNKDAMRLALAGEALPLWVSAERQSAGRGRAGRTWVSTAGNLHASVALSVAAPAALAGQLALVSGIALYEAVRATAPAAKNIGLRLKWPNDILIGAAKVGGILVESTTVGNSGTFIAVVGFGLNVEAAPGGLGRAAISLRAAGVETSADALIGELAQELDVWLKRWDDARRFDVIRSAWMVRAGPLGERITFNSGQGQSHGTYQGLNETGGLMAEVEGKRETITFGDVMLAAAADTSDDG